MPVYDTPQSGSNSDLGLNLTCVIPGDSYTLFDGTETPAENLASVAFARGPSPSMNDAGCTFYMSGCPADCAVDIQGANEDLDTSYVTLLTLSPDANGNDGQTDTGRAQFYRALISAYSSGDMPVVTVQR